MCQTGKPDAPNKEGVTSARWRDSRLHICKRVHVIGGCAAGLAPRLRQRETTVTHTNGTGCAFSTAQPPSRHMACSNADRNLQARTMAITNTQPPARPAMDEWGVYDPQQAGLAALYARLDPPVKPVVDDRPKAIENSAAPERPSLGDAK